MSNVIISIPSEMVEYVKVNGEPHVLVHKMSIPLDWTFGTGNTKFEDFCRHNIESMTYEPGKGTVLMVIKVNAKLKTLNPYKTKVK